MRQNSIARVSAATPFLALEQLDISAILNGRYIPSLEEETAALQEATDIQAEITSDLNEASRTEEITDTMMELADQAESITELTPVQAALIDTASEAAVAGTDNDPDSVVPSMEKYIGKNLAQEGFAEDLRKRADEVWQRIRAFVTEMWNRLVELYRNIFLAVPRNLARIARLREEITAKKKVNSKDQKSATIKINVGVVPLSYNGYVVKSAKELDTGLHELVNLTKYCFTVYPRQVRAQADVVLDALKKFKPDEAQKTLGDVASKVSRANFTQVPNNPTTGYLGDFDLTVRRIDPKRLAGLPDGQILNALYHTKVEPTQRVAHRIGAATASQSRDFATMNYDEMYKILTSTESLLKSVLSFEGSSDQKGMSRIKEDLVKAGTEAQAKLNQIDVNNPDGRRSYDFAKDVVHSLQNFSTTFMRWNSALTPPVLKKVISTSKASLILVEKSLAQY